jgi:AraC-like DNA-binding protein
LKFFSVRDNAIPPRFPDNREFAGGPNGTQKRYIRKDPRIKVIDIYQQVGFTNQQHFTKIFKKVTGYTPNAYRKKVLE